ncbi:Ff.00g117410.m01.CDS01 [Fusarium sp. VM40]|nr:Ff.00g117410.m01.CDS01 [Fusarium sp. VM40]
MDHFQEQNISTVQAGHDMRQVAGVRRYRSKSQRPCDLCRARKVLCNIPDPTRPCQLCERTGRHCTFVGNPNKKQRENGIARHTSVPTNPSFDRVHVEPSRLPPTPHIPVLHSSEHDRDSVGVGLTPLMSHDIFSAGADINWNLSLDQDGVDDGQTFDFFADGELPNLEPIEDQTPPDIYRDSGVNITSTEPPDGLTNVFERLSFDQRPNYSTSLIGYSNESDPFSLNHFPYASTSEVDFFRVTYRKQQHLQDETHGQIHNPVHFLQSHTETSAKGQNIVQKFLQDLDTFVAESSTGLLAGIYALALPFTPWDEKLCLDSAYSKPDINDLWQVSYTCLQKELHFPHLSTIQTYLLLLNHTPFDAVCVENPFVWSLAASMLAMAQSLGLNVDPTGWKLPAWEVRLRRRLWWAVYVEYTWRSVTHGRASMISDEDWDVLPLKPEDFVVELAADVPEHIKDRSSDYFIHFCSLTEIASQVCRKFFSLRAVSRPQILDSLLDHARGPRQQLLQWLEQLPESLSLRPESSDGDTDDSVKSHRSLYVAYYTTHILILRALLRPIIDKNTKLDHVQTSVETVLQACRGLIQTVIKFIRGLDARHQSAFWPAFTRNCLAYPGLFCYMLCLQNRQPEMSSYDQNLLATWRKTLRTRMQSWPFLRFAIVKVDAIYWKKLC